MNKTREMYIPEDAKLIDNQGTDATIYFFKSEKGKPCLLAFQGRAIKPKLHYYYDSEEGRQKRLDKFLQSRLEEKERKEQQKLADQNHGLSIGDILVSSWGYDQTNIDFYQVVGFSGKITIELRPIERNVIAVTEYMSGTVMPRRDAFISSPFKGRFSHGAVTVGYHQFARPWNGKPEHYTSYA